VKEEVPLFIVNAVRGVSRSEKGWVSRQVAAALSGIMRGEEPEPIHFSPREMEVLRQVTNGKTNQQIAVLLGVSEKTIEKYVYDVYAKIGVSSRTAAAVYAVREGLVPSKTE
jgi:DNA-binding NarL/FixJ family response regulator